MKPFYLMALFFAGMLLIIGCETAPLHRGYRWYCRGAYGQAIETLTYYLEHSSDSDRNKEARAAGFFYRGLAKAEIGRIQDADADYREALSRVPDFFYASFNIGVRHIRLQQYDLALAMFRKSWNSILKAYRGELEDSLLWNRRVFSRDSAYCFLYYGMALVMCEEIDELGTLLKESNTLTFDVNKESVMREVFIRLHSRKLTSEEARLQVKTWLKNLESGRGLGRLSGF